MKIELTENERDFLYKELTGTHQLEYVFKPQSSLNEEYKNSIIRKIQPVR